MATVVAQLTQTAQPAGTVATAANTGFTQLLVGGTVDTGNSFLFNPDAAMGEFVGLRMVQGSTTVAIAYLDYTNTNPDAWMLIPYRFNANPTARFHFLRGYPDATRGGTNWSLYLNVNRTVDFVEGSTIRGTSTDVLTAATDYMLEIGVHGTTGAVSVRVWPWGVGPGTVPNTVAATVTGTMVTPFTTSSLKYAVGNASAMPSQDTSSAFSAGYGGALPRPDVAALTVAPATGAGPHSVTATASGGGSAAGKTYTFAKGDGSAPVIQGSNVLTWTSTANAGTYTPSVTINTGVYPPDYGADATYWPSANTTGIPAGTTLTPFAGPLTANTAGAVYDSLEISGIVTVNAANVTFQRCRFLGPATYGTSPTPIIAATNAGAQNLLIRDCEVNPQTASAATVGVDAHHAKLERVNLGHLQDCIRVRRSATGLVELDQCYLHDLTYFIVDSTRAASLETHNDLIQIIGGTNTRIHGCTLDAHYSPRGQQFPNVWPAGQFAPNIMDNPRTLYGANSDFMEITNVMFNVASNGDVITNVQMLDNYCGGGYQTTNSGDPGLAGANLGIFYRNRVTNETRHATFRFSATQTADAGEGTPDQNTYVDSGNAVAVSRNG